jgi:chemotaxis protein CheD
MKQHRFFDRSHTAWVRRLLPGEFASSKKAPLECSANQSSEALMTVLGSCVAVCLWDKVAGVIGMNHFMLPEQSDLIIIEKTSVDPASRSARYGSNAMELLINEMLFKGAQKDRLTAWVFGGAQILAGLTDIGLCNIQFARQYLVREKIAIKGQDTGGSLARKLYFALDLHEPECRLIEESLHRVQHRELRHAATIARAGLGQGADISLFEKALSNHD